MKIKKRWNVKPKISASNVDLSAWLKKPELMSNLTAIFSAEPAEAWRGVLAIPPGSTIEAVLTAFKEETDIPLELPFFSLLHSISGYLLDRQIRIDSDVFKGYPDLWTIALADSGAGKTLAHNIISKASPVQSNFPQPAGGAAFIQAFQQHNFGLWFCDEIAQTMKQIESPRSSLSDVKQYLLQAYGNDKIERATKTQTITINEPVLGIFGINTPESFVSSVSAESLLDGFAQRFAYVYAEKDPARDVQKDPYKYALYNLKKLSASAAQCFNKLQQVQLHPVYTMASDCEEAFRCSFSLLMHDKIPMSFYRRVMFRAFKYALLYHVILGKETAEIDAQDVSWGARVCYLHLQDVGKILRRDDLKQAEIVMRIVNRAREKVEQIEKDQKRKAKPSDLQRGVHGVGTVANAKALLDFISAQYGPEVDPDFENDSERKEPAHVVPELAQ